MQASWSNVPPAPKKEIASIMSLGDKQLTYRIIGSMLQNMGDTGGKTTPFEDYNYKNLQDWFFLADSLDPKSNFIPLLAAYYYGATNVKSDLAYIVEYLSNIGVKKENKKWRWLAQAVFIARYRMKDTKLSLKLANELASIWDVSMPVWAKQMPNIIISDMGDKEASYNFIMNLIIDDDNTLSAEEVNFMANYLCKKILSKEEADLDPVCK